MREDLESEIVTGALAMAIANRSPGPGLIHHSDRGSQYTSLAFGKALSDSGLVASMGRSGSALRQRPHRELLCNPEIGANPRSALPIPFLETFIRPGDTGMRDAFLGADKVRSTGRERPRSSSVTNAWWGPAPRSVWPRLQSPVESPRFEQPV